MRRWVVEPLGRRSFLALTLAVSCTPLKEIDCERSLVEAADLERHGELAEALSLVEECLPRLVEGPDDSLRARFQLLLGRIVLAQGAAQDALDALDEISLDVLARPETAAYWMHRGYALSRLARHDESQALLERAEALAVELGDVGLQAEVVLRRGTAAARAGAMEEAQQLFHLALERAAAVQDPFVEAMALTNLGRAYLFQGRYDEALDLFERAIPINRSIGSLNALAKDLGNRGLCFDRLGRRESARSSYEEAVRLDQEIGNPVDLLRWLGNIGNLHYRQGELELARASYEDALRAAREHSELESASIWLNNLSTVSLDAGAVGVAERYHQEALSLSARLSDEPYRFASRINAGRVFEARGQLRQAETVYREAAGPARRPDKKLEALSRLGELYVADDRLADAEKALIEAVEVIDAARGRLRQLHSKMSYLSTLMHPYRAYVDLLMRMGRTEDAFELADAGRARTLSEMLDQPRPGAAEARLLPTLAEIGDGRTVVLSYWLAPHRCFLWASGPGFFEAFELPPRKTIEQLVARYRSRIVDGLRDPIDTQDAAGRSLFDMLIGPAAHLVPSGARVLLAPDGVLSGLNFESLLMPGSPPRYWIEEVTLSVAPSLRTLRPSGRGTKPNGGLLLVGDPDSVGRDFAKLPDASREVDAVQDRWGRQRTEVLRGADANVSDYHDRRPGRFRLIHFAAHAEANAESPLDSAVILSRHDGGFKLYARDVIGTPLEARLVTLSACRSAGAAIYAGEGLVGFAWAFLTAGASNVIAGLWNVSDRSTAELMEKLYVGLAAGKNAPDALREAKLSLIAKTTADRKPFYWAPFQIHTTSPV